jgi:hypothetical protein
MLIFRWSVSTVDKNSPPYHVDNGRAVQRSYYSRRAWRCVGRLFGGTAMAECVNITCTVLVSYHLTRSQLFKHQAEPHKKVSEAGPDAQAPSANSTPASAPLPLHTQTLPAHSHPPEPQSGSSTPSHLTANNPHRIHTPAIPAHLQRSELVFTFSPDMKHLVSPPLDKVPYGTDTWAVHHGKVSVTPLRATFCPGGEGEQAVAGNVWTW